MTDTLTNPLFWALVGAPVLGPCLLAFWLLIIEGRRNR
jgi:hypothetical protein